ncbi:MAG: 1-deoxy-D-xylulose-5-phosphate synthase [Chloroflexi bacterium]|nr:1-deoxy-D-xylulose-5-phosphate synthase [Chloroflexota bacterium]
MADRQLDAIDGPDDLKGLGLDQLRQLAAEIRGELVSTVTRTGGHLASNLGVVELTIGLHAVFDSPKDLVVWDVGHQAYVHKLLTGRRDRFHTIRQFDGLGPFCTRDESPHDAFGAGHAATSISAALGMAVARDLQGERHHVVAVIGDGALTCGLAYEALNNAGHLGSRLIVVLNDNEMSISPNVGAVARYLNRLRADRRYHQAKADVEQAISQLPWGTRLMWVLKRFKHALRNLVMPTVIWEELGFTYVGPVDGHDLSQVVETLQRARMLDRPVFIHVATVKGKGYAPAEKDAVALHGVSPSGSVKSAASGTSPGQKAPTYTDVFARTLSDLAHRDERIVAITAAMPDGTGLTSFAKEFPRRFFDVGIAEAHAVTFAGGLAARGMRPVVAIYSTFLQRSYDSIAHDVCLQNLPVTFALDRAGIVGEDGRTHQGIFDFAYLRCLPNIVVMAPRDENELRHMLATALHHDGPAAVRYPRGQGFGVPLDPEPRPLPIGQAQVLRPGDDIALIAIGASVQPSLEAADLLRTARVEASVVNARFVKPLDVETILDVATHCRRIVTVEEHVCEGGFGSAVVELLADHGLLPHVQVHRVGLPQAIIEHGPQSFVRDLYGLSPRRISAAVLRAFPEFHPAVAVVS